MSKLNQLVHCKDVLMASEWKPGDALICGTRFPLVSTEEENLWTLLTLIKIPFEKDNPLEKEKQQLIHRGHNHIGGKEIS